MTLDQGFRDRQCGKLHAQVHFIGYDYEKKIGYVVLADDNCVDMTACIQMFEGIDARVRTILTFAGSETDTFYWIGNRGEWCAATVGGSTEKFLRAARLTEHAYMAADALARYHHARRRLTKKASRCDRRPWRDAVELT